MRCIVPPFLVKVPEGMYFREDERNRREDLDFPVNSPSLIHLLHRGYVRIVRSRPCANKLALRFRISICIRRSRIEVSITMKNEALLGYKVKVRFMP